MKLTVKRKWFTGKSTVGELYIDGKFECYTLEDIPRATKVNGETCISPGTYKVIVNDSKRFGCPMPLLCNVPNFEGVRIHWGNYAADTDGCILVGTTRETDFIGNSRAAYKTLFAKIQKACDNCESVIIEIINEKV